MVEINVRVDIPRGFQETLAHAREKLEDMPEIDTDRMNAMRQAAIDKGWHVWGGVGANRWGLKELAEIEARLLEESAEAYYWEGK